MAGNAVKTERSADELADDIVDDLFTNGFGEKAGRLVMVPETWAGTGTLGGWGRDGMRVRILRILHGADR